MKQTLWKYIGVTGYWLLLPAIFVYATTTKPRSRVLLVHDNHVLVVKNWLGAGNWALPGGGIESGENPAEAAIREVKEELGFDIEPGALQPLGKHTATEKGGLRSKYFLFAVELLDRPPLEIKISEIVGHEWVSITSLMQAQKGVSNTVKQSVEVWSEG